MGSEAVRQWGWPLSCEAGGWELGSLHCAASPAAACRTALQCTVCTISNKLCAEFCRRGWAGLRSWGREAASPWGAQWPGLRSVNPDHQILSRWQRRRVWSYSARVGFWEMTDIPAMSCSMFSAISSDIFGKEYINEIRFEMLRCLLPFAQLHVSSTLYTCCIHSWYGQSSCKSDDRENKNEIQIWILRCLLHK